MGYFPVDAESVNYLRATGRTDEQCSAFEAYFRAQKMFGMPRKGEIDYSVDLELDLGDVQPSVAGPKRPQDRINLPELGSAFRSLLVKPLPEGGYGKSRDDLEQRHLVHLNGSAPETERNGFDRSPGPGHRAGRRAQQGRDGLESADAGCGEARSRRRAAKFSITARAGIGHGSVLIAAITSCTNTSNPSVMLAAGLLAKKAVERGLTIDPAVKTSLAPGSRVVSDYLQKTGLQEYLDQLGFNIVGYGCTTCIGNSGPLHPKIEKAIARHDLIAASVLSGNRNFEARVHQNIKANFLMSPPLVVAFALAGRVDLDLNKEPLAQDKERPRRFPEGSLAVVRRNPRHDAIRAHPGGFPQALSRLRRPKSEMERDLRPRPAKSTSGMRRAITFTIRLSSPTSPWRPAGSRISAARVR